MVFPERARVSFSLTTFFRYLRLCDDNEEIKSQQDFPILSANF